ncbi:PAS domain S-box protein [Methanomicrobium antiquum]|uniref:histidine kinase n=1 Tax=Methanomicrobium antiquum TaxID=487686 RepID=A0AAF0FVH0_9EURY|nr:histidine kinase dimerization/phosphoacceptor domain -containing protein [Methanomicrobium antiquum]WFN36680.1 PAS domain S-box protein [Methanomicrobium antiquum]
MNKKKEKDGKNPKKVYSYESYLFSAIFLLTLFLVTSSLLLGFAHSSELIHNDVIRSQDEVSSNIYQLISTINKGLEIYDMSLNSRAEAYFKYFYEEYEKSGRNLDLMNLESLKQTKGDDVTFYIIDENFVITHSTNPSSIGLDFKSYAPHYTDYLERVRLSSGFFPERVLTEAETGLLKKFAYMPSPDNKYIFEVSILDENFNTIRKNMKYTDAVDEIVASNPYVKDVRIFNVVHKEVGNSSFSADSNFSAFLDGIFSSETGTDVYNEKTGRTLRYIHIPGKSEIYASDNSLIAEIQLDNSPFESMMAGFVLQFLLLGIFSTGLCIAFAIIVSHHFSSRIKGIVDDISIISAGDLNHSIKDTNAAEFQILNDSINLMVKKIRKNIKNLEKTREILTQEKEKAEMYFSLADVIFIISDIRGIVTDINQKSLDVFEYTKTEAIGNDFFSLIFTDNNREIVKSLFYENIDSDQKKAFCFRCKTKTKGGEIKDVSLSTVFLRDNDGKITGWLTTGNDETDEIKIKRELESSLNQKNALLREVHHRVKNNLQVMISLLDLKSYSPDNKELTDFIKDSKSKINAMALVHEIMYRKNDFKAVNISEYTKDVISGTFSIWRPEADIDVFYDIDSLYFDLDHSIPYGILITELASNALIHAFKDRKTGKITISLKKKSTDTLVLVFSDDGCGLLKDSIIKEKNTVGMNLIRNLTRQLSGEMEIVRGNGTTFIITFENPIEQIRF